MTYLEAYMRIIAHWGTPVWQRIPEHIAKILSFRTDMGMISNILCTEVGSDTMTRYITHMNRDRTKH